MAFNYSADISDSDWAVVVLNLSNSTELTRRGPSAVISINYGLPTMIVLAIILTALIIATALGNLLVCVALFRYRALRTISNCLIGNLAASDFLLAVTVLPLSAGSECLGYWAFGHVACNVWLVVDVLCCTASIWNLCIIAADRYTATVHPVWYRDRSSARRRALAYIGVVWAVSVAVCLPPLFGWNNEENFLTISKDAATLRLEIQTVFEVVLLDHQGRRLWQNLNTPKRSFNEENFLAT